MNVDTSKMQENHVSELCRGCGFTAGGGPEDALKACAACGARFCGACRRLLAELGQCPLCPASELRC